MMFNSYQEVPAEFHARWTGARAEEDEEDEELDGVPDCQGQAPAEFLRDATTPTRAVCARL